MFPARITLRLGSKPTFPVENYPWVRCFHYSSVRGTKETGSRRATLNAHSVASSRERRSANPRGATIAKCTGSYISARGVATLAGTNENQNVAGTKIPGEPTEQAVAEVATRGPRNVWNSGAYRRMDKLLKNGECPNQETIDKFFVQSSRCCLPPQMIERIKGTNRGGSSEFKLRFVTTDLAAMQPWEQRLAMEEEFARVQSPRKRKKAPKEKEVTENIPSELSPQPRADILGSLKVLYASQKISSQNIAEKRRVNVVNGDFCDQIIKRLGASLQKHRGCEILDINPGAGIWSEKLHDYLKPRSHILMEPSAQMYLPLLQPLLDQPGSTYKLIPQSGIFWASLEEQLSDMFSDREPSSKALDPGEPNNTLLITGNLCTNPVHPYRGFPSYTTMVLYQFLEAARARSLFHRYGSVRMLLWVNEIDQAAIVPRTLSARGKASVEVELTCQDAAIVATAKSSFGGKLATRQLNLELEGMRRVRDNMKQRGVEVESARKSELLVELEKHESGEDTRESSTDWIIGVGNGGQSMRSEFLALQKKLSDDGLGLETPLSERRRHARIDAAGGKDTKRLFYLNAQLRNRSSVREKYDRLVQDYIQIQSLDKKLFKATGNMEKDKLAAQIKTRTAQLTNAVRDLDQIQVQKYLLACDHESTFHSDPPLMFWDRRELEPLKSLSEDCFPHNEIALLDLQPKLAHPVYREDYSELQVILHHILDTFMTTKNRSVDQALRSLWPGAAEWLLAECPSLRDPSKGGASDLKRIRARTITGSTYLDMTQAWLRWPFRPHRHKLLARLGNHVHNASEE